MHLRRRVYRRTAALALATGLVAGCSGSDNPSGAGDQIPPGKPENVMAEPAGPGRVQLTWRAPGDDDYDGQASSYQVRTAFTIITLGSWSEAEPVPGAPTPRPAGGRDSLLVSGLSVDRTYHFALRALDEAGNEGRLSDDVAVYVEPPDLVAPAAVTDLDVWLVTRDAAMLTWTAVGDDSLAGTASRYQVRYSTGGIDEGNWSGADTVRVGRPPLGSGITEQLGVEGLQRDTIYYFALKVADEAGNWSPLSNVVSARTQR